MPTYLIANRPRKNSAPSENAMAEWNAWFDALGVNLVDRGNPAFTRRTVGNTGADTVLGGYTLVKADDLAGAVALAKGCPVLKEDGGVEVAELTLLNDGLRPRT